MHYTFYTNKVNIFEVMKKIEMHKRILECAIENYSRFGYHKVTMDDIAFQLGISKKTLYNHFNGKEDLLKECINYIKDNLSKDVEYILRNKNLSFTEKLKENLRAIALRLSKISSRFGEDLQKHAPALWEELTMYKKDTAVKHFSKLLEEGTKTGHINKNINQNIAVLIYMNAIENILNPDYLNKLPYELTKGINYSTNDLFNDIVRVIYEGILTEDAKKML